jgi:3-dehydroquinate dehydratase-2
MIKMCIIHGPNLNLLGIREPDVYGLDSFDEMNRRIKERVRQLDVEARIFQFNNEGDIIEAIHDALKWADGLIINPGAYTHYSYAIRDAITAIRLPTIEVHITNVHGRDEWRRNSVISPVTSGQIVGFGTNGYLLAVSAMKTLIEESHR